MREKSRKDSTKILATELAGMAAAPKQGRRGRRSGRFDGVHLEREEGGASRDSPRGGEEKKKANGDGRNQGIKSTIRPTERTQTRREKIDRSLGARRDEGTRKKSKRGCQVTRLLVT